MQGFCNELCGPAWGKGCRGLGLWHPETEECRAPVHVPLPQDSLDVGELCNPSHPQPWSLPGTMWSNSASPRLRFGRVCGLFLVASAHHGKSD